MNSRLVLIVLTAAWLCGHEARAAIRHSPHGHAGRRHTGRRHAGHLRHRRLSVEMRDSGGGTGRAAAQPQAALSPGWTHARPSVETALGHGGVASFGYHPGAVPRTLGPHELDGAAEPRLGHGESEAGVSVKIPL